MRRSFLALSLIAFLQSCSLSVPETARYVPHSMRDYDYLSTVWPAPRSGLVKTYRSLGSVLYSACKNLPSDSQYIVETRAHGCSYEMAFLGSVARLLREADLVPLYPHDPILYEGRLRWVDLSRRCE